MFFMYGRAQVSKFSKLPSDNGCLVSILTDLKPLALEKMAASNTLLKRDQFKVGRHNVKDDTFLLKNRKQYSRNSSFCQLTRMCWRLGVKLKAGLWIASNFIVYKSMISLPLISEISSRRTSLP